MIAIRAQNKLGETSRLVRPIKALRDSLRWVHKITSSALLGRTIAGVIVYLVLGYQQLNASAGGEQNLKVDQAAATTRAYHYRYGVYLFGIPVGLQATVTHHIDNAQHSASSSIDHILFKNQHSNQFAFANCDYRPQSYSNQGQSPGWKFYDSVEFDRANQLIRYAGFTKRPSQEEGVYRQLVFPLDEAIYVDKLNQFLLMGCALKSGQQTFYLSYVDDSIGHYEFNVVSGEQTITAGGQVYSAVVVEAAPYEFDPGSVHTKVRYWLAPDLNYMPLRIKTRLGGLSLTVKLLSVD